MNASTLPRIAIHEVAPRDGLQMEPVFVPTDDKVAWIDGLSDLGYAKIEVTSFVSASAIPALRDVLRKQVGDLSTVIQLKSLPRNPAGKVMRKRLAQGLGKLIAEKRAQLRAEGKE